MKFWSMRIMRSLIKDFITQNLYCEQFLHNYNTTAGLPCQHGVCRSFAVSVCSTPDFIFEKKFFGGFRTRGGIILATCFLSVNLAVGLWEILDFNNRESNPIYISDRGRGVHQSKAPHTHTVPIYLLQPRRLLCGIRRVIVMPALLYCDT